MKKRKKGEWWWEVMRKVRKMKVKIRDLRTKRKRSMMRKRLAREVVATKRVKGRKAFPR